MGDLLLRANTTGEKFVVMVIAVLLFAVVMAAILFAVDRPKRVPGWVVALGFVGPAILMLLFGLIYPAIRTTYQSFFDRTSENFVGLDNYVTLFTRPEFLIVLRNTAIWVLLVPIAATVIGLIYAVLVDRTRFESLVAAV